jgi:RNA-directed DNA polymerase
MPTILDRALQALIVLVLDPIIEEISDKFSFGSRKFRGTNDAMIRLRNLLDKPKSPK